MSKLLKMRDTLPLGILLILMIFLLTACADFLETTPTNLLTESEIFKNAESAESAVVGLYNKMTESQSFSSGTMFSFIYGAGLSSDELINMNKSEFQEDIEQLNGNEIEPDNSLIEIYWNNLYAVIYGANAVLEGLSGSDGIEEDLKMQFEGEARFIRAFHYLYLVNVFGGVPLAVTTDYRINKNLARSSVPEVYELIIDDLRIAKRILKDEYSGHSGGHRIRANKSAAIALLARVYLYTNKWEEAEINATTVINNTAFYSLENDLTKVFRTTSKEVILQLWSDRRPQEVGTFSLNSDGTPRNCKLTPQLTESFEPGDLRKDIWIRSSNKDTEIFYTSRKYSAVSSPPDDYSTLLRLAEQHLIRAEARVRQNKLTEARQDIDAIRSRAHLPLYADSVSLDEDDLLEVIIQERRTELFAEGGHRWLDLKRMGLADEVCGIIGYKEWENTDSLYPIPYNQILNTPALKDQQNPGYGQE